MFSNEGFIKQSELALKIAHIFPYQVDVYTYMNRADVKKFAKFLSKRFSKDSNIFYFSNKKEANEFIRYVEMLYSSISSNTFNVKSSITSIKAIGKKILTFPIHNNEYFDKCFSYQSSNITDCIYFVPPSTATFTISNENISIKETVALLDKKHPELGYDLRKFWKAFEQVAKNSLSGFSVGLYPALIEKNFMGSSLQDVIKHGYLAETLYNTPVYLCDANTLPKEQFFANQFDKNSFAAVFFNAHKVEFKYDDVWPGFASKQIGMIYNGKYSSKKTMRKFNSKETMFYKAKDIQRAFDEVSNFVTTDSINSLGYFSICTDEQLVIYFYFPT